MEGFKIPPPPYSTLADNLDYDQIFVIVEKMAVTCSARGYNLKCLLQKLCGSHENNKTKFSIQYIEIELLRPYGNAFTGHKVKRVKVSPG